MHLANCERILRRFLEIAVKIHQFSEKKTNAQSVAIFADGGQ